MRLVHITVQFQYTERIEQIVDEHGAAGHATYPMVHGVDRDGRHDGTKVHPGNVTVVQALVPDERVDALLGDLQRFRDARPAHGHLEAAVIAVERTLSRAGER